MPLGVRPRDLHADEVRRLPGPDARGRIATRVSVDQCGTPCAASKAGILRSARGLRRSSRRWRGAKASACTSTARGCSSRARCTSSVRGDRAAVRHGAVFALQILQHGVGADLARPAPSCSTASSARARCSASLAHAWPFAAVALHYLTGFDRYTRAVRIARRTDTGAQRGQGVHDQRYRRAPTSFISALPGQDAARVRAAGARCAPVRSLGRGRFLIWRRRNTEADRPRPR